MIVRLLLEQIMDWLAMRLAYAVANLGGDPVALSVFAVPPATGGSAASRNNAR